MGTRFALALGIVVGILAAAILALAVVSMAGGPAATVTLPPASAAPAAPPSGGASGSPAASALASAVPVATSGATGASPGASPGASSASGGLFGVGLAAPPLQVERLGGGTIDLASLRGKPVWVVFTGTYCPPCRDEYPFLESFATRYASTGLVVVTVHEKDDAAAVSALTSELGITFPVGLDPAGTAGRDWKAIALPIHFWVDRDGIVRAGALGGVGPGMMASSLATILPGIDVTPAEPAGSAGPIPSP
jgi:cytochrome c biogenesis protein CcmG/thiol:disulfide interchange protein DsbE